MVGAEVSEELLQLAKLDWKLFLLLVVFALIARRINAFFVRACRHCADGRADHLPAL